MLDPQIITGGIMLGLWLLLMAVVVWAIVCVVRGEGRPRPRSSERALAWLEEKYARGEIDREAFERERERLLE